MEATAVEVNQGIAARVRAVRKQGEQQQKADTHTGRKDLWSISFFIWRKGRICEFGILVAITAEEGFGNLREGDIAEQVFSAGVRIAILGQTCAEFFQLRFD